MSFVERSFLLCAQYRSHISLFSEDSLLEDPLYVHVVVCIAAIANGIIIFSCVLPEVDRDNYNDCVVYCHDIKHVVMLL